MVLYICNKNVYAILILNKQKLKLKQKHTFNISVLFLKLILYILTSITLELLDQSI